MPYLESGQEEQIPMNSEEHKLGRSKTLQESGAKVKDLKTLRKVPYKEL